MTTQSAAMTIRTLAVEYGVSLDRLMSVLELTIETNDVDQVLRPRVEAVFRLVYASEVAR